MSQPVDLHPDLGPVQTFDYQGEPMINMAGVLAMARTGATPEAKLFYRSFSAAYASLQGSPLSDRERQWQALRGAWAGNA